MAKVRTRRKSWRYANTVRWAEAKRGSLTAEGKPDIEVATPPDFGGHEATWSPEDLFVAAVNGCIMTTFLYYQGKEGIELVGYASTAEGVLEFGDDGLVFTRVEVRPEVVVASETDRKKAERALQRSEEVCLISNSVSAAVTVTPQIRLADGPGQAPGS